MIGKKEMTRKASVIRYDTPLNIAVAENIEYSNHISDSKTSNNDSSVLNDVKAKSNQGEFEDDDIG